MVKCSVQGCSNYQGKKGSEIVRFFCFPKSEQLSAEWLHACGKHVQVNLSVARICSEHFGENEWKLQDILLNIPIHKRKLKEGAIPSLNLPGSQSPKKREERMRQREQKKLVDEAISIYNRKYVMNISTHFVEPEVDAAAVSPTPGHTKARREYDPLGLPGPEAERLRKDNRDLKVTLKRLKTRLREAEAAASSLRQIFTEGQIKRVKNPHRKYKWSYEDISFAASLYSAGPTGYAQLIKRKYPLPTPATLRKWSAALKLKPGILSSIVYMLSNVKCEEVDRLCILSFHEFALKPDGHDEVSNHGQSYKSAQSVIVLGLMSDWKQIIYYGYDCNEAIVVIKDIIRALKEINFTVVAVVSGVGHLKLPLWVEAEVDHNQPYTEVIPGEKVFFFGNVPHLIKNFRNCFVETGFVVNGTSLNIDPLKELLRPDAPDLQLSFKLTEAHLSSKKVTRQRVQLAWQLLTHSVADELKRCISMGVIHSENAIECSDLIQLFSAWLDVFNAKCATRDGSVEAMAYGLDLEEQNAVIILMTDLMNMISRTKSKKMFPFQRGILLNNASLMQLREYLTEKYKIDHVVTNRFNQDDLEESLKIRRANTGLGGQPTALEFRYRINLGVLSTLTEIK